MIRTVDEKIKQELEQIVGKEFVLDDLATRMIFSRTVGPMEFKHNLAGDFSAAPSLVVQPKDSSEISKILILANKINFPVVPFGGASGISEGTSLPNAIMLDTKRLNEIEINPINMTASVGAGVNGYHLEEFLNIQGYTCGHFPQSLNSATMGGYVATAAIGTFSGRYGKMEDIVVGLEVVLPQGQILTIRPIPRRSTGPHLESLFIGSEGTLGVMTRAVIKIHPLPEKRSWLAFTFENTPVALLAIRNLIRTDAKPALVRLYDEDEAAGRVKRFNLPQGNVLLFLAFEGEAGIVDWQIERAKKAIQSNGGTSQSDEIALDWFDNRFDTSGMLKINQIQGGVADSLEVAAPWDKIEAVWREMRRALKPNTDWIHVHFSHIYDSECSAYVIFGAQTSENTPESGVLRYQTCLKAALEACLDAGGSISHHHGVGRAKSPWMRGEHGDTGWEVLSNLKKTLDPNMILNPGTLGILK